METSVKFDTKNQIHVFFDDAEFILTPQAALDLLAKLAKTISLVQS